MNIATTTDYAAIKRAQALEYGIDQLRRAASAIGAASHGESREMRRIVLQAINERMISMLAELKAMT
jgi:hypothetical protein